MIAFIVRTALLGLATLLLTLSTAHAIKVEPGQWQMSYSITMPMFPNPQTTSVDQCIDRGELKPEDLNQETENPCTFSNVENSDDEISWVMSCPNEQGTTEGNWSFRSEGASLSGEGKLVMTMAGQEMVMSMTMSGRRTGACSD